MIGIPIIKSDMHYKYAKELAEDQKIPLDEFLTGTTEQDFNSYVDSCNNLKELYEGIYLDFSPEHRLENMFVFEDKENYKEKNVYPIGDGYYFHDLYQIEHFINKNNDPKIYNMPNDYGLCLLDKAEKNDFLSIRDYYKEQLDPKNPEKYFITVIGIKNYDKLFDKNGPFIDEVEDGGYEQYNQENYILFNIYRLKD